MLSSLWLTLAWGADCPDPLPFIRNAEQDAVSYFLADAEAGLADAAASFSCAKPDPTVVARFFIARAMIWKLQEDGRSEEALHRAKQLAPTHFTEALGDELKKEWEAIEVETIAPTIQVSLRGMKKADVLLIDGTPVDLDPLATTPGLHLVQIERKEKIVYGRVVEADAGDTLEIALTGSAPPKPDGTGSDQTRPTFGVAGPITKRIRDAEGHKLSLPFDVVPIAVQTPEGRSFERARRRNTALQGLALGSVVVGTVLTYQSVWELNNNPRVKRAPATVAFFNGVGLLAGGVTVELVSVFRRPRLRRKLVEQANSVLEAP